MRLRKHHCFWALWLSLLAASAPPAQDKRAMTLVDLLEIPQLGDPRLSPNGAQILFTIARPDWQENSRVTNIWRIGSSGIGLEQMTNGPRGESSPRWNPDGSKFAFLARRPAQGEAARESTQIYIQSNSGGEARQWSRHETPVSNITWAPAGDWIYFLAADAKSAEQRERERLKDDVFAFDGDYQHRHLWRISTTDRREERLTEGDYSVSSYTLSRDGKKVVLSRGPSPLLGDRHLAEIHIMDAGGGVSLQLTHNRIPEGNLELSPDNSLVLFTAGANRSFEPYYNSNLFVVPAAGGRSRLVDPDFPFAVESAVWSRDGQSILMLVNMGVHDELFEIDPATGRHRQWTDGEHDLSAWTYAPQRETHVLIRSTPTSPGEVYVTASREKTPSRVTSVCEYVPAGFRLPREERIRWKGADGVSVEGILTYPLDYEPGKRYPLAVYSHGGPQSSDKLGFSPWREYRPVMAAMGYAFLRTNYRGSTGYGNAFLRDMVGHYFHQAHLDVLAGVDHLIQRGIADPDRLVKFGWSAGGHMTNKIVTFTDRFKAASSGAGAVNWVSMYAQSDVRDNRTLWFGGTPWQENAPIQTYWDNSPLKDVARVRTPTLILVGENDERVPMTQSVELFRALKSNAVATRLHVAPREPHGWGELRHQLFKMNVELDWFEKHATERAYTWEKAPSGQDRAQASPSR